ncbi:hypothetical protein GCM10022290_00030 [Sagittula marina]
MTGLKKLHRGDNRPGKRLERAVHVASMPIGPRMAHASIFACRDWRLRFRSRNGYGAEYRNTWGV